MKIILRVFLLVMIAGISFNISEAKTLDGVVKGKGGDGEISPLPGATIQWLGSKVGTHSKKDGRFSIERLSGYKRLVISYVGFEKDTIEISSRDNNIDVLLNSDLELEKVRVKDNMPASVLHRSSVARAETITKHGLRKAACCNLAESFQTNPSVDVNYSDAISGARQIELLGLSGKYSQFLVEKMPLIRGLASMYGLSYIPGSWMQSIQVSKGAATVSTGYESISGQINVEYKKPHMSEKFFINAFANQMGRAEVNINNSYNVTDEIGMTIFLHGSQMQNEVDDNDDGFLDLPKVKQLNLMNRWNWRTDNNHMMFGVKGLYEDRKGGQKGYEDNKDELYGLGIETKRFEAFFKNGYIFDTDNYQSLAVIMNASVHDQNTFFGKREYDAEQKSFYVNLLYDITFGGCNHDHDSHEDHDHDSHEDHDHASHEGHDHDSHEGHDHANHEECDHESHEGHDHASHEEQDHKSSEGHEAEEHEHHHHEAPPHKISTGLSWMYDDYRENLNSVNMDRIESIPGLFGEYTYYGLKDFILTGGLRADFHNKQGTFISPRLHMKYDLNETTSIRISSGKGFRTSHIYAENIGLFASSRALELREDLDVEEAWNHGISLSSDQEIFGILFTLGAEYFRTDFVNQVVVDLESSSKKAIFYNLDGESYSNAVQFDLKFEPFRGFVVTSAYRYIDVQMTINDKLMSKPLISNHKAFINLDYTTKNRVWQFDVTGVYNGSGRIPNTEDKSEEYRLDKTFPAYFTFYSQITFNYKDLSVYIGSDNLGNYIQDMPILAYDKPFGDDFDASMVWGPLHGRAIYMGMRYEIK